MANERKMTLRYQVKIDKMTTIDINIILVYLPNNNSKIMKDNQTSSKKIPPLFCPAHTTTKENFQQPSEFDCSR